MLNKFSNQKVRITYAGFGHPSFSTKGVITDIDDNFIEIDNKGIIAIKYISSIEII